MEGYVFITQGRELVVMEENGLITEVMTTSADDKLINQLVHIGNGIKVEFTKSYETSKYCRNNIYCEGDENCVNCTDIYARIKNLVE